VWGPLLALFISPIFWEHLADDWQVQKLWPSLASVEMPRASESGLLGFFDRNEPMSWLECESDMSAFVALVGMPAAGTFRGAGKTWDLRKIPFAIKSKGLEIATSRYLAFQGQRTLDVTASGEWQNKQVVVRGRFLVFRGHLIGLLFVCTHGDPFGRGDRFLNSLELGENRKPLSAPQNTKSNQSTIRNPKSTILRLP
jgi:hypothetical protein